MQLLNKSQLAEQLGRCPTYVSGMVRCGYRMKFGSKTTLKHALSWLAEPCKESSLNPRTNPPSLKPNQ